MTLLSIVSMIVPALGSRHTLGGDTQLRRRAFVDWPGDDLEDCSGLMRPGIDFYGEDLRNVEDVAKWQDCKELCNDDRDCMAWTYGKECSWWQTCYWTSKVCYMKHKHWDFKQDLDKDGKTDTMNYWMGNNNVMSGSPCKPRFEYDTKGKSVMHADRGYGIIDQNGGYCFAHHLGDDAHNEGKGTFLLLPTGTDAYRWVIPHSTSTKADPSGRKQLGSCYRKTCKKAKDVRVKGKARTMYWWGRDDDYETLSSEECRRKHDAAYDYRGYSDQWGLGGR